MGNPYRRRGLSHVPSIIYVRDCASIDAMSAADAAARRSAAEYVKVLPGPLTGPLVSNIGGAGVQ